MNLENYLKYKGTKDKFFKETGEEGLKWLYNYEFFPGVSGNSQVASEWLGYTTRKPVARRWRAIGLEPRGRSASRVEVMNDPYIQWSADKSLDEIEKEYLKQTGAKELALNFDWKLPKKEEFGILIPISDLHLGNISCDYEKFLNLIEWIEDTDNVRWILAGDNFDAPLKNSPTSSLENILPLNKAIDLLYSRLLSIVDKCICIFTGNHELRLIRLEDLPFDPSEELSKRLNVPFLGYSGYINHIVGNQQYTHMQHHGFGGARTIGGKINKTRDMVLITDAELITMGHQHTEGSASYPKQSIINGSICDINQLVIMLPSFLKYGRGYGREHGFSPMSTGVSSIHMYARKHSIHLRQ